MRFSVPHVQRCENRTQLDFIAEQCSQTDSQALYLRPKSASFYTWIPAVGFTQGGLRESHRNRRVGAIIYSFFPPPCLPQPGEEQCRHLCQSDGENFLVSRGAQFVDGTRCEWAGPPPFGSTAACLRGTCQVECNHERQVADFMSPPVDRCCSSLSSAVWL